MRLKMSLWLCLHLLLLAPPLQADLADPPVALGHPVAPLVAQAHPIATRPLSSYWKPIRLQLLSLIQPLLLILLQPPQVAALHLGLVLALALALVVAVDPDPVLAQALVQVQDLIGAVVSPLSILLCK